MNRSGTLARARREIDTMQTFEPHHVVHKSFTGLCTTAVLDDSIRCNTSPLEVERSLRRKPERSTRRERGHDAERDFASGDRAVTTASDVGASAEAGLGKFYGTSA